MELNFQQRWEFIRDNGSDTSSNDSKCSSRRERAFTNVTSIDSTVLGEDDESTDAGKFQQKSIKEPSTSGKCNSEKQRERRKGKEKKSVCNKKRKGKSGRRSIGKNVRKATSLNSLEKYTNSLVEDLKVARQDLVIWMKEQVQEIIREETATESERMKCSISREKLQQQNPNMLEQTQTQHRKYLLKNAQPQHHINTGKWSQVQQPNKSKNNSSVQHQTSFVSDVELHRQKHAHHIDTGKCSQVQQLSKSKGNSTVQHPMNFVSDLEVHRHKNFQDGDQLLNQSNLLPGPKLQKSRGENIEFGKRKRPARSNKSILAQGDQVDNSLAIVPATTIGKLRGKKSPSPAKSKFETGPPNHQQKNIVLGIRAQSCNDMVPSRASRGKRTASCQSSHPKHDLDQWQALSSIQPTEKHQNGIPSLSSETNLSAYSSSYIASVLQLPPLPLSSMRSLNAATNAPDPASFSSFDPAFVPSQTGFDSTTLFSKLLGSSDGNRYFQTVQPQENSRASLQIGPKETLQIGPKETGFSNQKTAATPVGARNFQAQHYQPVHGNVPYRYQPGFDNLLRQSSNMSMPSLMMNGVAGLSGKNYHSLSDQYICNSFLSYPGPNTDGRLMTSQGGFQFQK